MALGANTIRPRNTLKNRVERADDKNLSQAEKLDRNFLSSFSLERAPTEIGSKSIIQAGRLDLLDKEGQVIMSSTGIEPGAIAAELLALTQQGTGTTTLLKKATQGDQELVAALLPPAPSESGRVDISA